jgi:CHAT domain-containing protein/tetratricopeptide (TPR) repeat protein
VAREGAGHELLTALILDRQAANHTIRARYRDAQPLVEQGLAIRERLLGPRHFLVAASLGTLADLHHDNTNYREAAVAADRAFDIAAQTYEPSDVPLGDFINRVARAQLALGNFARAEQLYRQSLEVREKTGAENLALAASLLGLARVALLSNDNVNAERLHTRTLTINERILGPDHPKVGTDVLHLGLLQYRRRDYTTAVARYARALAIYENAFGASHPLVATTLNNLGLVYWRQRDYARAEEFFGRALQLAEELFGTDSLRLANPLANLGILAKETGDYALAETRYKRAIAIKERHLGPDHAELISPLESLAILYRDRGDYPQAKQLFQRTLGISEASFGPDHPFVARHLDNIAHLNWAGGHWDQAFAAWQGLLAVEERNVPLNIATGSERQKLAFFEPHLRNLEEMISFHVQQPADHAGVRDLAVTTVLQRKGRVLDALADTLTAFRNRANQDDQTLLAELSHVTSGLAAAVLADATSFAQADRRRLSAERERLEIEINRRSAGYVAPSIPVTLPAVQNAVPSDAALVEFVVYRPFDARSPFESGQQFGPPRYIAYVVRNTGEPAWKDLGPADEIDRVVDRFRTALADPTRPGMTRVSRELHQRVLNPLVPLWDDATHLLISPDGALNLIPFEALRGSAGRYLIEDVAISYVTTGRDLVRMQTPRPPTEGMAVFADPSFGERVEPTNTRGAARPASARAHRSITAADDPSAVYFPPLAGTASEAQRIRRLFPEVELRIGARATEAALKTLKAPRILHIATHGFFLQDSRSREAKPSNAGGTRALRVTARIENPLLRSGLALAGANLTRAGDDDGILTALEAANLNLWGTKLVTLSACDTGIGVVRNGEGVYGLRRAFFLAGAESIVMSLWPVSDLITREMMTSYYAGLKQGLGRGAALRRVQLQMLKRKDRSHPFYWASFIQAGEWASLDGRR